MPDDPAAPTSARGEGGCNAMRGHGAPVRSVFEGGLFRVGIAAVALNHIGT